MGAEGALPVEEGLTDRGAELPDDIRFVFPLPCPHAEVFAGLEGAFAVVVDGGEQDLGVSGQEVLIEVFDAAA